MNTVYTLLVGVGDYSTRPVGATASPDLRGAGQDVRGWIARLDRMGVPRANTTVLCTPPGGYTPSWADGPATRDRVLRAMEALAARLAGTPHGRALIVMSGHGGQGGLLQTTDGAVQQDELVHLLDRYLPGRGVTAILDLCIPVSDDHDDLPALRPVDLLLLAADGRHPAEEHDTGSSRHGAFTWALHQVLDRWMGLGPHGAAVPISPRVLIEQTRLVLAGLGYGQWPRLVGPRDAQEQGLLGTAAVRSAPLQPVVTRELNTGSKDDFQVYDLNDLQGGDLGVLVVTGANFTASGGYVANREYWSAGVPSVSFTAAPVAGNPPGTVPTTVYAQVTFNPGGSTPSTTVNTPGFEIKNGGTVVGYVHKDAGHLDWYCAPTVTTRYPLATLTFNLLGSSVTTALQHRQANKL